MKKGKHAGEATAPVLPDWYWSRGLHDAVLLAVHELALPVNWKERPLRYNCLEWHLDGRNALFETGIRCICLYNYTLLAGELERAREPRTWWFSDTLTVEDKGYRLEVVLEHGNGDRSTLDIRFAEAVVERN